VENPPNFQTAFAPSDSGYARTGISPKSQPGGKMKLENFQHTAISSTHRWRKPKTYPSKNDWLNAIESEATTLANMAKVQGATQLSNLCQTISSLASAALESGYELNLSDLEPSLQALEKAEDHEQLSNLTTSLTALEEDAAMFVSNDKAIPKEQETPGWKRILTVDDSGLVRSALKRIFKDTNAKLEEAKNGTQAIERISEISKFDLILLDLEMPDLNGIQVLEQIRRASQDVVVVMLTSSEDIKKAITTIREGADGYFQKQDLPLEGDKTPFFDALEQARNYRAGIIARRQLEQLKTDFYSMITHDIRNPANVVELAIDELLEDKHTFDTNQQKMLVLASDAAKKMISLVTDYLDYAKIDAGYLKIETKDTDLCKLIQSSSDQAKVIASEKNQTLTLELPETLNVFVDEFKLKQVLDNLISNAVKYTPEHGSIEIKLEQKNDFVRFSVKDTGHGISSEHLKMLFEKFVRLPGETHRSKGTGLGLVIVKAIVEGHGGKVWAESKGIGAGSIFQFEIPIKTA
jgi:signal transduction histidine kinase